MSTENNMSHMEHLPALAQADVSVLEMKEATYKGSWKAAGGRSAWFMFRRNMDRLLNMCAAQDFLLDQHRLIPSGGASLGPEDFERLQKALRAEDIFKLIEADPSGNDGTVLACLRDLRRYALLVEAEMVSRGVVQIETGREDEVKKNLLEGWTVPKDFVLRSSPLLDPPSNFLTGTTTAQDRASKTPQYLRNQDFKDLEEASSCKIGQSEILEALALLRPDDASDEHRLKLAQDIQASLDDKDFYTALSQALDIPRGHVKFILLGAQYGLWTGGPSDNTVCRDQETATKNWEKEAVEHAVGWSFPELGEGVRQEIAAAALKVRPGGSVYGRIAEVVASRHPQIEPRDEESIRDLALGRLYAAPDTDYNCNYDRDEHKRMVQAVSHALNYNSIDAALGCADHILAELVVPHVIQHLRGETSCQLLEAGWTFGAHGRAIPPLTVTAGSVTADSIPSGSEVLPYEPGPVQASPIPPEVTGPGSPDDGGNAAGCGCGAHPIDAPIVPRIKTSSAEDLYVRITSSLRASPDRQIHASVLSTEGKIGHLLVYRQNGQYRACGTWATHACSFPLCLVDLENSVSGWIVNEVAPNTTEKFWI